MQMVKSYPNAIIDSLFVPINIVLLDVIKCLKSRIDECNDNGSQSIRISSIGERTMFQVSVVG